jgi:hypothetical protein
VAINDDVAAAFVLRGHNDDRCLLPAVSQRRDQLSLPVRLANSQMLPSPVQLMKLQLHRRLRGFQYGRNRHQSFPAEAEVCRELSSNLLHTP